VLSEKTKAPKYRIKSEIYIQYAGAGGKILLTNGKITIGKFQIFYLVVKFCSQSLIAVSF
jgi:hypothetical protein